MNFRMCSRRLVKYLLLAAIAVSIAVPVEAAKTRRVPLKPKNAGQEVSIINLGKARTYYPLSSGKPTVVSVKGPGELRVLTRVRFTSKSPEMLDYRIIYKVDGAGETTFDAEDVSRSESAKYRDADLGIPGDSEDLKIKFGRGYHTLELTLRDSMPQVAARFLFTPRREKKTKWVSLAPLAPNEPVDLIAGEGTVHYYRFSAGKPMKIEIIGPTDLRIMTRVENSFNMKGRANYRMQIRQDGKVVQSFQLSSLRSETTTYKNNRKLVPGKAREIVFRVPKGMQRYEIVPLDKGSLLGQVMFPRKDVKLGL